jgi:hypothetical protein
MLHQELFWRELSISAFSLYISLVRARNLSVLIEWGFSLALKGGLLRFLHCFFASMLLGCSNCLLSFTWVYLFLLLAPLFFISLFSPRFVLFCFSFEARRSSMWCIQYAAALYGLTYALQLVWLGNVFLFGPSLIEPVLLLLLSWTFPSLWKKVYSSISRAL